MTDFASFIGGLSALSLVVVSSLYIVRSIVDKEGKIPSVAWNVLALVGGVAYCLGWQINITGAALALVPALAGHASRLTGVSGQILTGLTVGAFSGFFHEVLDALRGLAGKSTRFVPASVAVKKK